MCVYVHTHISYIRGFPQNNSVIISFVFVLTLYFSITVKPHIYMCVYIYIEVDDEMSIVDDNDVQVFPSLIT